MKAINITTVCLVLFAFGCSKQPEDEYFPEIRDGSQREYSMEYSVLSVGVQKGRIAYRIDGTETIDGMVYYQEIGVISGIPGMPAITQFTRRDKQGIHVIDGNDKTKSEYLAIPFPIKVGNSWTANRHDGEYHYRAEAIETLQLFDRKYERCLKITFSGPGVEGYSYLAPGVGEVKGVFSGSGFTMEYTLDKK